MSTPAAHPPRPVHPRALAPRHLVEPLGRALQRRGLQATAPTGRAKRHGRSDPRRPRRASRARHRRPRRPPRHAHRRARPTADPDRPLLRRHHRRTAPHLRPRRRRHRHRRRPDQRRPPRPDLLAEVRVPGPQEPGEQAPHRLPHRRAVPLRIRQRHHPGGVRRVVAALDHPVTRPTHLPGRHRQPQPPLRSQGRHATTTTAVHCCSSPAVRTTPSPRRSPSPP